jgi:molecular chaperone GrpE
MKKHDSSNRPPSEPDDSALEAERAAGAGGSQQSLEAQLEAALGERDNNHNRWLRAEADLDNYRKRSQKEAEESRLYRSLPLVRDLLPVIDNLQRAIAAAAKAGESGELVQGVKLVLKQFEDVLAAHSVQTIEAVGQPFDPNLHAAVQQVPSADYPPMTVVQELERGYRLHDRVVRPSQVIVSSSPPNPA